VKGKELVTGLLGAAKKSIRHDDTTARRRVPEVIMSGQNLESG
jgi:hypothetical protein